MDIFVADAGEIRLNQIVRSYGGQFRCSGSPATRYFSRTL